MSVSLASGHDFTTKCHLLARLTPNHKYSYLKLLPNFLSRTRFPTLSGPLKHFDAIFLILFSLFRLPVALCWEKSEGCVQAGNTFSLCNLHKPLICHELPVYKLSHSLLWPLLVAVGQDVN